MSEAIQFIQLDDSEDSLKMMKLMVTAMMKEWQNQVINLDTPKREEYQTEEEFKDAYNEFMMETINDIKGVKKSIFQNINEINSNFLNLKRDTINSFRQENEGKIREKLKEYCSKNKKEHPSVWKKAINVDCIFPFKFPCAQPLRFLTFFTSSGK